MKLTGDALRKVLRSFRDNRDDCARLEPQDEDIFSSCAAAYAALCKEPYDKIYNAFKPKRCVAIAEGAVYP